MPSTAGTGVKSCQVVGPVLSYCDRGVSCLVADAFNCWDRGRVLSGGWSSPTTGNAEKRSWQLLLPHTIPVQPGAEQYIPLQSPLQSPVFVHHKNTGLKSGIFQGGNLGFHQPIACHGSDLHVWNRQDSFLQHIDDGVGRFLIS